MSELMDTTEMYLKTIYELVEEGVPPLRARIVERLGQSGPTVSETVARLERDGLIKLDDRREITFTPAGYARAAAVVRRHRLAEVLLLNVIKMPWEQVHNEACRWEHAISEQAAEHISELLGQPETDPFGNPMPSADPQPEDMRCGCDDGLVPLNHESVVGKKVVIARIAELIQVDEEGLADLSDLGVVPGAEGVVSADDMTVIDLGGTRVAVPDDLANHVYVALK
ncbi:metal-dependent transcriptional regulator [Arcanobacterium buesumense]|uniref:Metal-dependent transcriptional regulator n=1 Tax=Arcanobacterium buesumense TaxID=2722751 RepID=A0A6H2EMZ6_9ACTO|nr:metal-dependent transcriptional regulator [Arcanobacterium buesumense]QJC22446.1 metal-dependent transcriptional regulator [Arcanobacterium buesumense]